MVNVKSKLLTLDMWPIFMSAHTEMLRGLVHTYFSLNCFGLMAKQCVILLVCYLFPLQKDLLENYKCGADFLPSPLASKPRFALKVNPALTKSGLLTSVAVAVENDHTIAFLGNNQGEVFKVELSLDLFPFLIFKNLLPD